MIALIEEDGANHAFQPPNAGVFAWVPVLLISQVVGHPVGLPSTYRGWHAYGMQDLVTHVVVVKPELQLVHVPLKLLYSLPEIFEFGTHNASFRVRTQK